MSGSVWFSLLMLLAVHAHGASAANDIDETVAIVIFAILIAVFAGIAIVFAFLIIRLKQQERQGANKDLYDTPHTDLDKRTRDLVRINSDQDITGFSQRQQTEFDTAYERKTPSDFSAFYINPGYSNDDDIVSNTTISTFQLPPNQNGKVNRNSQCLAAFSSAENTHDGGHFVTLNASFDDKDSPVMEAKIVNEKCSSDQKSDAKLSSTNSNVSLPTDAKNDIYSDENNERKPHQDPTGSHTGSKRKSFGALFKREESRESQKPLLLSQSSNVSSMITDSPAVREPQLQISPTILPDTFEKNDDQNEESKL